jgi:hypothetical protein
MTEMQPFTQNDWYGFAGASRFEDGSEPLIGEVSVHICLGFFGIDGTAVVIADASGVSLDVSDDEGDALACYYIEVGQAEAIAIARALPRRISSYALRAAGFQEQLIDC